MAKIVMSFTAPAFIYSKVGAKIVKKSFPITNLVDDEYVNSYKAKYTEYEGAKGNPYTKCIELDTDNPTHMKLISGATKMFTHCFSQFTNNERKNDNMIKTTCLQWDFDSKGDHDDMTLEEFRATELAQKYEWFAYASKSHGKGGDAFHVIVPLATEFVSGEAVIFRESSIEVARSHGIACDNTHDAPRLFNPGRYPGKCVADNFFFGHHKGETLNIDDIKANIVKKKDEEEEDRIRMQQEYLKRREEGKGKVVKPKYVNYSSIKNAHEQVEAILVKRAGHPAFDDLVYEVAYDICSEISESDYTEWVTVGHAIKRFAGDMGTDLWSAFCRMGSKFDKKDLQKYPGFNVDVDGAIQPLMKCGTDRGWVVSEDIARKIIGVDRALKDKEGCTSSEIEGMKSIYAEFSKQYTEEDIFNMVNG